MGHKVSISELVLNGKHEKVGAKGRLGRGGRPELKGNIAIHGHRSVVIPTIDFGFLQSIATSIEDNNIADLSHGYH